MKWNDEFRMGVDPCFYGVYKIFVGTARLKPGSLEWKMWVILYLIVNKIIKYDLECCRTIIVFQSILVLCVFWGWFLFDLNVIFGHKTNCNR